MSGAPGAPAGAVEVVISRPRLARIERAAAAAFPEECCGLLAGSGGDGAPVAIAHVVDSPNIAADRHSEFEIDPSVWLSLRASLRGEKRVVGLFHSHPDGPAEPSDRDRAAAWGAGMVWLITGMAGGRVSETRAWLLSGDGAPPGMGEAPAFVPVRLTVRG